jgi:hypothetical protein
MDDTGTRVNGENHHCQILCNPLYGAYFTTARKDRLTILDVLRNERPRVYRINEEALESQVRFGVSQRVIEQVRQLASIGTGARRSSSDSWRNGFRI